MGDLNPYDEGLQDGAKIERHKRAQLHNGDVAKKIVHDLSVILTEAERHGTATRLPQVAIYFNETELRQIIAALSF